MPFADIMRAFEQRRVNLAQMLYDRKHEIDLSRQHQIYGAIKEVDVFLQSLREQQVRFANKKSFELAMPSQLEEAKNLLEKLKQRFL
ncbi:hypothetical protein GOV04_02605 [Candidatus Woesearchaeota archaeon]|nr:hypothetical protein [Candidatus Woesearchaeota archaeon]